MSIKKFLIFLLFSPLLSFPYRQQTLFTLMLNPAGDAKDAGRMLNDCFERGVTLQFAQELKQAIETHYPNVRVVLTRIPGETLEFLQNANFANRLDVDFYLSIHFYKETDVKPKLFLYHYLNDLFIIKIFNNLNFTKYNNAHLISIDQTKKYGESIKKSLEKNTAFSVKDLSGIPFKPLVGIKAPAIAIEAGLKESLDYKNLVEPVLQALNKILTHE